MKKEEIHFLDFKRWLFGEAPGEFMIEVVLRTFIIYLFLLLVVRLMGKRLSGQITITELAVMVTLGAIISPVMQLPDRGILFGIVVLTVALAFQRGINLWAFKNEKVEQLTEGTMSVLIKDGKINVEELEKAHVTRQQLFAMLREQKIKNLAQIKRAYLEACGILSVYVTNTAVPGLPIYPMTDPVVDEFGHKVDGNKRACCTCGNVQEVENENTTCNTCNSTNWSNAYLIT